MSKRTLTILSALLLSTGGCESMQNFVTTGKFESSPSYQLAAGHTHSPDGCATCAAGGHAAPDYLSVKHGPPPLTPMNAGPAQQNQQAGYAGRPAESAY